MITVHKTRLDLTELQDIHIPRGAEFLCVREQYGEVCVWYRCDTDVYPASRRLTIVGTGHAAPPPNQAKYLGSAHLQGGHMVLHVFEWLA